MHIGAHIYTEPLKGAYLHISEDAYIDQDTFVMSSNLYKHKPKTKKIY